jgi:thioredoxin-dependent peroxiredoxin
MKLSKLLTMLLFYSCTVFAAENPIGQMIPQMTLDSSDGKPVQLPADLKGKWSLIYFYPKDDTPGCTKQACSYRDSLSKFKKLNVQVYGVSMDDLTSHADFIKKFKLNFPLLSDPKHQLGDFLGTYQGSNYYSRDSFLIDPNGKVVEVWRKVNPDSTMHDTYAAVKKRLETK